MKPPIMNFLKISLCCLYLLLAFIFYSCFRLIFKCLEQKPNSILFISFYGDESLMEPEGILTEV